MVIYSFLCMKLLNIVKDIQNKLLTFLMLLYYFFNMVVLESFVTGGALPFAVL